MSDLDAQISAWRLAIGDRLDAKAADELEDHLRTTIDLLLPTGLSNSERLLVASYRLGHPDTLAVEFAKNDPSAIWRDRLAWMLIGMVPIRLVWEAASRLGVVTGSISVLWGIPLWATALLELVLPATFLAGIIAVSLWVGRAALPIA